jgi:hypothetical protein
MKRSMSVLLLMTILGTVCASSQVSFNIVIRTPTPAELPTWERDRTIVTVAITNAGQISYPDLRVSFVIRNVDNGRTVARGFLSGRFPLSCAAEQTSLTSAPWKSMPTSG